MRKKEGWELMDHGSFEHSNESGVFGNILLYTIINSIMLTSEHRTNQCGMLKKITCMLYGHPENELDSFNTVKLLPSDDKCHCSVMISSSLGCRLIVIFSPFVIFRAM